MKSPKTTISFGVIVALLATACGAEGAEPGAIDSHAFATPEIVSNLKLAGFPESEIQVHDDDRVFVGMDAEVSLAASREMLGLSSSEAPEKGVDYRQYRTTNVVAGTVNKICIDGSDYTGKFSTGLDTAIQRYNALNLLFSMSRTNGAEEDCDALIDAQLQAGGGGIAGFPANGLPFDTINLGRDLGASATSVITHVIEHELGHTLGFRHTDFFDRRISCGTDPNPNEGQGGIGAVHIPGTPVGAVLDGSVMNACFNANSTGVFTASDITALTALYTDENEEEEEEEDDNVEDVGDDDDAVDANDEDDFPGIDDDNG